MKHEVVVDQQLQAVVADVASRSSPLSAAAVVVLLVQQVVKARRMVLAVVAAACQLAIQWRSHRHRHLVGAAARASYETRWPVLCARNGSVCLEATHAHALIQKENRCTEAK